jgi:hypothetical protein
VTVQERKDRIRTAAMKIYLRTVRRDNLTFIELKQQAERTVEYCKQKRYPEPKFALRVLDIATKQLDFIACREAELKALRRGTAEGQLRLADIRAEDAPETLPGDAKNSENGVQIARGLIVDSITNKPTGRDEKSFLASSSSSSSKRLEVN